MDIILDMCSLEINQGDDFKNNPTSYINKYKWKNYLNKVLQFITNNGYQDKESIELIYLIRYMLTDSNILDIVDTYSNTSTYSGVLLDIYNSNKYVTYKTPEYLVDYC